MFSKLATSLAIALASIAILFTLARAEEYGKHPTPRADGIPCQEIQLAGMENISTTVGTTEYTDYSIDSAVAFNEPPLYALFDADGEPNTVITWYVGASIAMTHTIHTANKEWSPIYPAPRNATSVHIEVPTGKGKSTSFCLLSGNRKGDGGGSATALEETAETHLSKTFLPIISK